jgi:hypothetical protein
MNEEKQVLVELIARRKVVTKRIDDIEVFKVPYDGIKLAEHKQEQSEIDEKIAMLLAE